MSVARSRAVPETADSIATLAPGWWTSAFESLSPVSRNNNGWSVMAKDAAEAAGRHWRALAEMQISAAEAAWRLTSSHLEHRQETLTRMIETLWPVPAATPSKKEAARD